MDKYLCIKEVLLNDHDNDLVLSYFKYFKVGNIFTNYEDSEFNYNHLIDIKSYNFKMEEMEEFFITINQLRNQTINKILEDE